MSAYDLSFGKGNPRNSEGAFLPIGDHELIFVYSSFTGDAAMDHTHADLGMIRSRDGGVTWSEPRIIVRAEEYSAMNIMSVSLLRMQNGDIGLFYLVRKTWYDMPIVLQRSADQGETWSTPICCSTRPSYYVLNNDRAVRLSSGRIILPAADHPNRPDANGNVMFGRGIATFFLSDDDGKTWFEAETPLGLDVPVCNTGLQEPGIVELPDGSLYGWARTDLGRQYEFRSADQGLHWSAAMPSWFTSPTSPLSMKRLEDGRFLAIWNPVPKTNISQVNRATGDRTPLVYSLSMDGRTWQPPVTVEDDPNRGYCYTAIQEWKGTVLLAYNAGSDADLGSCLSRLRIRRLDLQE